MEEIERFLNVSLSDGSDGSGDGSGSGYGYGDDGYGDGSGYGGYGSGDGVGSGDGYGYGSGDGYGYGSGDGYSGDGYGYGYSGDIIQFCGQQVHRIDDVPTIIETVFRNHAKGAILNGDLTLTPCYVARVGDSFAHGQTLRQAVADATAKDMEQRPLKERLESFVKAHPIGQPFPAKDYYEWHHILTGSCRMGRDEFCKAHGIQMDDTYTPVQFIHIVKDAYGGDVIEQLTEYYNL